MTKLDLVPRPSENDSAASLEERRHTLFEEGSPYAPVERSQIVGVEHVLERVDEVLHWLVHAERYVEAGSRLEPGVLFAGPPGTGKTLAARYLASASGALFVDARSFPSEESSLQPSDVRALFRHARGARLEQARPIILFWDELDAVVSSTGPFGHARATDICSQLIQELDGIGGKSDGLVLLACTNAPEALPPSLRRRGRIGTTIPFHEPDLAGKALLLSHYAGRFEAAEAIDYRRVASLFNGATPASALEEVAGQAWREAIRRSIEEGEDAVLCEDDLHRAALDHVLGPRAYPRRSSEALLRTAVHEIGHALVALAYGIPVRIVSCRQGTSYLGVTAAGWASMEPESVEQGLARLRIGLAGALAEVEAGLGQGGGSENDVAIATRVASQLVASHGLGAGGRIFDPTALGGVTGPPRSAPAVSEWLLSQVDEDAATLLQEAAGDVRALLGEIGGPALLALGEHLAERETLDGRELEEAVRDLVGELPNAGAPRSCLVVGSEPGAGSLIGDSPSFPIVNHFPACAS